MKMILSFREQLGKLYSRYSLPAAIIFRFVLGLFVFTTINSSLGYMERADSGVVVFGLSVLSALLPLYVMVFSAIALILAHLYALAMSIMLIVLLVFILLYIFYFRFTPGKTWTILLVPIAFFFDLPLIIPVIFGLLGTPVLIVPAIAGTWVFYILHYIQTTEVVYAVEDIPEMMEISGEFVMTILVNPEQWLIAFVLGIGTMIVYALRTRSFPHCWKLAFIFGTIWIQVALVMGSSFLEIQTPDYLFGNAIVAIILGFLLEFFFHRVDYKRTEYLQFDDNEYYYYVKAIPKIFSDDIDDVIEDYRSPRPRTPNSRNTSVMSSDFSDRGGRRQGGKPSRGTSVLDIDGVKNKLSGIGRKKEKPSSQGGRGGQGRGRANEGRGRK